MPGGSDGEDCVYLVMLKCRVKSALLHGGGGVGLYI